MSTLDILTWPERMHRFRMEGEGKSRGSPGKWPVNYAFIMVKVKVFVNWCVVVLIWTPVIAPHGSDSWSAALYNLGSGSWLAVADGHVVHCTAVHCPCPWTHGVACRHITSAISRPRPSCYLSCYRSAYTESPDSKRYTIEALAAVE